jgi:hypothetical protein
MAAMQNQKSQTVVDCHGYLAHTNTGESDSKSDPELFLSGNDIRIILEIQADHHAVLVMYETGNDSGMVNW